MKLRPAGSAGSLAGDLPTSTFKTRIKMYVTEVTCCTLSWLPAVTRSQETVVLVSEEPD